MRNNQPKDDRNRRSGRVAAAGLLLLGLVSCTAHDRAAERYPTLTGRQPATGIASASSEQALSNEISAEAAASPGEIFSGRRTSPSGVTGAAPGTGETIVLNFEETDLRHAAKALLGDFLGLNFTIDPEVKGTINLKSASALEAGAALSAFETVLRQNGAALVTSDGIYRILPIAKAKGLASVAPIGSSVPIRPGYSVRVVPLRFIGASEMAEILKPFQTDDGAIRADSGRNLVILSGTSGELRLWQETIDSFDIDWFAGKSVGLFPLAHATAVDVIRELEAIYGPLEKEGSPLRLVPIDRVNAVMAVAQDAALIRNIGLWTERLDRSGRSERQFHLYPMKSARAADVAPLLQDLFGAPRTGAVQPVPVAPGETPIEGTSDSPATLVAMTPSVAAAGPAIAGDLKIIPDEQLNALVILGTDEEFRRVTAALRKLDVAPLQVLVEATVAEVTITSDLRFGVQYLLEGSLFSEDATAILTQGQSATIAAPVPGFATIVGSPAKIILDALESVTEVNVISSPNLMVLDNETATLSVGNQVPVAVQRQTSAVNNDQVLVNTIEFRDTGVIFKVTPSIASDGMVTLDIRQEVSTVAPSSGDTLTPTISQRRIDSSVVVASGETIVLGGLFSDTANTGRSGLPLLSRAPIVGSLFGSTAKGKERTELVVLIQPRILRNQADVRALTDEMRRRVTGLTLLPDAPVLSPDHRSPDNPALTPLRLPPELAPAAQPPEGVSAAVAPARPAATSFVQIAAVGTEAGAREAWARAAAANPALIAGRVPHFARGRLADGAEIIRVQTGPMPLAEAKETCARLDGPCLVVE